MPRYKIVVSFLALIVFSSPLQAEGEKEILRRIHSFLLIEDPVNAVKEAEKALKKYKDHKELQEAYVKALAAAGEEKKSLRIYSKLCETYGKDLDDREMLEEISWGILQKASQSSQYAIRLSSLIGSYLTNDARAVKILQKMMSESSALLRAAAVRLAGSYPDGPLQEEILKLLSQENSWMVKLELLQTVGRMRLKAGKEHLEETIANEATIEEKAYAIEALIHMHARIDLEKIFWLAGSDRAGLRQLSAHASLVFGFKEAKDAILPLIYDGRPDVRMAALNVLGIVFLSELSPIEIKAFLDHSLKDLDPVVAITACWLAMLFDPSLAEPHFERWLFHEKPEYRYLAAAALAKSGKQGASLALRTIRKSTDPYVRANLSMGLIGQRKEISLCCDILYDFLMKEKKFCSFTTRKNPLFTVLSPSDALGGEESLASPEAEDQMTRLELVSILAILADSRAQSALKDFLLKRTWGITGYAAAILLKEGDEEALELVRGLLQDSHPHVRQQAALVLAMLGKDESVLGILEEGYLKADHREKLQILEALGHIGKMESCKFLTRALDEPFEILRVVAASSLIRCLNN